MYSRPLQELRAAWLALGLLLMLALPSTGPALIGLTLLPWFLGGAALVVNRTGDAVPAFISRLTRDTAGRATLLAAAVLVVFVILLTNLFFGLLVLTWGAAASLVLASVVGAERLALGWQRIVTLGAALAVVSAVLEGVLRLPLFEERFGRPPIVEKATWERRYDGVARQNVFGFRTLHESVHRTPGVLRVLAIGDSHTWGEKVRSSDSIWPSLLEARLTRASRKWPTEVINISQPGWSTADEVGILERIGWQFQPDRLLVQFYLNDHDPPVGDPRFMRRLGRPPSVLKGGALQTSALACWLRVKYWATVGQAALHDNLMNNYAEGSVGWKRVSGGLRRIAASARARGVPATLVLFPALAPGRWTPETYAYRRVHRRVARAAAAAGMEVLDLTSAYAREGRDWREWWATPYDRHPGSSAHLVAARAIAQHLVDRGWGAAGSARVQRYGCATPTRLRLERGHGSDAERD